MLDLPVAVGDADYSVVHRDAFGVLNMRFGAQSENWNTEPVYPRKLSKMSTDNLRAIPDAYKED